MCIVSMTFDHYGSGGTPIVPQVPIPWSPNPPSLPPQPFDWPKAAPAALPWDPDALKLLREAIDLIRKLDAKLGLPDCEDPKKAVWLAEVERKVATQQHDEWGRLKQ